MSVTQATQPFSQNRPEGRGHTEPGRGDPGVEAACFSWRQGLSEGSKEKALKGWT